MAYDLWLLTILAAHVWAQEPTLLPPNESGLLRRWKVEF